METFALSVVKRLPKTRTALTVYPIRPQRRSLNVLGFLYLDNEILETVNEISLAF